ncbi:cathecol 1,2-dioxygenase [Dactylonectria estremocensis]|uniref:Cathecol 1,2-dioxygenase n=1 Tax=Dactylonectria estremocensis TaxID=1079267 RepID=A0A9P9EGI4_9HYPO|nr:cathecol 1,2-dioxygenase [Dactylonectria estremocensis]
MSPIQQRLPELKNLTTDNITENVLWVNNQHSNARLKYVLERLVVHVHDFARETRLSTEELMAGIQFLTQVGQTCSNVRQEFILLSDILGLSLLVDSIDHPKPPASTEGTVLGPFHVHEAPSVQNGDGISRDADGEPCLVLCTVKDTTGSPIQDVKVDIWETDSKGFYDVQYGESQKADNRCVLRSDPTGSFWFKAIVPVPYPIPNDGPVGKLLSILGRHPYRPSHMHFMFDKQGFDPLITALYIKDSLYENSDAVFGVKASLVVQLESVDDVQARTYGVEEGTKLLRYDFVLVSEEEAKSLRAKNSMEAVQSLGLKMKISDGLPVPNVD